MNSHKTDINTRQAQQHIASQPANILNVPDQQQEGELSMTSAFFWVLKSSPTSQKLVQDLVCQPQTISEKLKMLEMTHYHVGILTFLTNQQQLFLFFLSTEIWSLLIMTECTVLQYITIHSCKICHKQPPKFSNKKLHYSMMLQPFCLKCMPPVDQISPSGEPLLYLSVLVNAVFIWNHDSCYP